MFKENDIKKAIQALSAGDLADVFSLMEGESIPVDLQVPDSGESALMVAVYKFSVKYIQMFIEIGVDINLQDKYGRTATMVLAANNGVSESLKVDLLKLLLENKPDVSIQCKEGYRAYDYFFENKLYELADLIKAYEEQILLSSGIQENTDQVNMGILF